MSSGSDCCGWWKPMLTRAVGSVKTILLARRTVKIDRESLAECGAGVARWRQDGPHVGAADFPQRGFALGGPGAQRGQRGPGEVEPGGDLGAGPAPRRGAAAVQHDVEPAAQLGDHRL